MAVTKSRFRRRLSLSAALLALVGLVAPAAVGAEPERLPLAFMTDQLGNVIVHPIGTALHHSIASGAAELAVAPSGDLLAAIGHDELQVLRPGGGATVIQTDDSISWTRRPPTGPVWLSDSSAFVIGVPSETQTTQPYPATLYLADVADRHAAPIAASINAPDPFDNQHDRFYRGFDAHPSERRVIATLSDWGSGQIVLFDLDSGRREVLLDRDRQLYGVAWSPDGATVAYTDWSSVRLLDTDSGSVTVIDDDASGAEGLSWSPDGQQLAYAAGRRIVVTGIDGRSRVLRDAEGTWLMADAFDWTSDETLAVVSGTRLLEVTTSGSETTLLEHARNLMSVKIAAAASLVWVPPPTATVTSGPVEATDERAAVFGFEADSPTATFECRLNAGTWEPCTSPSTYDRLDSGEHTFQVRAIDELGVTSLTVAEYRWTINPPPQFDDVTGTHAQAIAAVAAAGITEGYSDNTFRPGENVTRAQMATFLTRALDLPASNQHGFDDVTGTHAQAIAAVAAAGITEGYSDNTFRPGENVTRAQMATFLARALELPT